LKDARRQKETVKKDGDRKREREIQREKEVYRLID